MFRSTDAAGSILFRNPSRPASKIAAIAMYGLADGSTDRNSNRVPCSRAIGTRINGERFRPDHAT